MLHDFACAEKPAESILDCSVEGTEISAPSGAPTKPCWLPLLLL
jgi:hypothetical protein